MEQRRTAENRRTSAKNATPTNEIGNSDSARARENDTFRHMKALCQGGVQDNDTKRQEGFGNAARFAKRVRIAMLPAIEGAEYIRSRWWEVIAFVVFS